VTKRIYGQKRTKKSEQPQPNADARDQNDSDYQSQQKQPAAQGVDESTLSKKEKRRRARGQVDDQITCQMGTFHRIWRVFGFILMMGLNIGIVGGDLMGGHAYVRLTWQREMLSLILLASFNGLVLFPILFEAWYVKADKDGIVLKAMFWHVTRRWDQVTDFKHPLYLKLAMLRFGRMFFFLNKRAFPDYAIFESLVQRYWIKPQAKV
jgi:hypothetical protein